MTTYYAVLESNGRVVTEYPVEGLAVEEVADRTAINLGTSWPDEPMPATCWVKLYAYGFEPGHDPIYYREHALPEGHCVGCAPVAAPRRSILDLKR